MTSTGAAARIDCPAGVFAVREDEIRRLTEGLNRAGNLSEKAVFASRLQAASSDLLACGDQQADNVNCRLCQDFSRLRVNTAGLILRTLRLAS